MRSWPAIAADYPAVSKISRRYEGPFLGRFLTSRYLTISSILTFILISLALWGVKDMPAVGYEVSIYTSSPPIFWIATIGGVLNGVLLFYYGYERNSKLWVLGLFQIILCNFLIISLGTLEGYLFVGRFDTLSYLGYAKDITLIENIPQYNFYPIVSIFLASFSDILYWDPSQQYLTGLPNIYIIQIARFLPATFFALYTVSILAWSKSLSKDAKFITSMMVASIPLFYAWFIPSLYHETLCVLMLPLLFYAWQKGRTGDMRFRSISYLLIVFITLFHPLVTVSVLIFLATFYLVEAYTKAPDRAVTLPMVVFALVVFLSWVSYQVALVSDLQRVLTEMFSVFQGPSTFATAEGMASKAGIMDTLQQLLMCTFDDIVFCLLALAAALVIIRKGRWRTHPLSAILACFIVGMLALAIIMFTASAHNPMRMINLNFNMVFTIPLAGFFIYWLRMEKKITRLRIVTAFVLVCLVTSVFSLNLSPVTVISNDMVTRSEVSGMSWFVVENNRSRDVYKIETEPGRFADLMLGDLAVRKGIMGQVLDTPDHFRDENVSLLDQNGTSQGAYVVLSTYDIVTYTEVWSDQGFSTDDFKTLNISNATSKVYENGGLRFFIRE